MRRDLAREVDALATISAEAPREPFEPPLRALIETLEASLVAGRKRANRHGVMLYSSNLRRATIHEQLAPIHVAAVVRREK